MLRHGWILRLRRFSCREQIAQGTNRRALHLAEVLLMALQPSPLDKNDPYPESRTVREQEAEIRTSMKQAGIVAGTLAGAGLLTWVLTRNR